MTHGLDKLGSLPFVSVIIPCYNTEKGLLDTLESLSAQDYPADRWEVIVVDNNSTDNTCGVARSYEGRIPSLRIEVESRQSSYAARNKGILASRGEILAFIDADMTVQSSWIRRGVARIAEGYGDYVGCRVDIYPARPSPNLWETYNIRSGFQIRRYMMDLGFAGAGNIFLRRAVLDSVGMFDSRLVSSGDLEFGNRVRDASFRLYYDHENPMRHPARSSFISSWRKMSRLGNGHATLRFFFPERYGLLSLKPVVSMFFPIVHLGKYMDMSNLGAWRRCKMYFVANILQFAYAVGQLKCYFQRRVKAERSQVLLRRAGGNG